MKKTNDTLLINDADCVKSRIFEFLFEIYPPFLLKMAKYGIDN